MAKEAKTPKKRFWSEQAPRRITKVHEVLRLAEQINEINFRDHGTWGGNVTDKIYDAREMTTEQKIIFVEVYLNKERDSLMNWLFS